jgi:hypothetical protein
MESAIVQAKVEAAAVRRGLTNSLSRSQASVDAFARQAADAVAAKRAAPASPASVTARLQLRELASKQHGRLRDQTALLQRQQQLTEAASNRLASTYTASGQLKASAASAQRQVAVLQAKTDTALATAEAAVVAVTASNGRVRALSRRADETLAEAAARLQPTEQRVRFQSTVAARAKTMATETTATLAHQKRRLEGLKLRSAQTGRNLEEAAERAEAITASVDTTDQAMRAAEALAEETPAAIADLHAKATASLRNIDALQSRNQEVLRGQLQLLQQQRRAQPFLLLQQLLPMSPSPLGSATSSRALPLPAAKPASPVRSTAINGDMVPAAVATASVSDTKAVSALAVAASPEAVPSPSSPSPTPTPTRTTAGGAVAGGGGSFARYRHPSSRSVSPGAGTGTGTAAAPSRTAFGATMSAALGRRHGFVPAPMTVHDVRTLPTGRVAVTTHASAKLPTAISRPNSASSLKLTLNATSNHSYASGANLVRGRRGAPLDSASGVSDDTHAPTAAGVSVNNRHVSDGTAGTNSDSGEDHDAADGSESESDGHEDVTPYYP